MKKLLIAVVAASMLFACSKDDSSSDTYTATFKSQPAQGKIKGAPFQYIAGKFEQDYFDETDYLIELYDKSDFDTVGLGGMCSVVFYGTKLGVDFNIPKKEGRYELSDEQYVTFITGEMNVALPRATKGAIEILKISDTQIVGKVDAYLSDETYVNGEFTVEFCK